MSFEVGSAWVVYEVQKGRFSTDYRWSCWDGKVWANGRRLRDCGVWHKSLEKAEAHARRLVVLPEVPPS